MVITTTQLNHKKNHHHAAAAAAASIVFSQQSLALEVLVDLPAVHVALRILQLLVHLRVEAASVAVLRSKHSPR
jgi:hypothetical protein